MRAQWVVVARDFAQPPERVFDYLAEHEHLEQLFGAKIERVRDGYTERNGIGSVRRLKIAPGVPEFDETVTAFERPGHISYRISRGSPLDGHVGIMRLTENAGGGTHLDYRIRIASRIPGLAPIVAAGLRRNIAKGLKAVDTGA
jgi:uncharacterized protein YndB with AHSA1/START domain